MKFDKFVAILALTTPLFNSVKAHHKCDDPETAETNDLTNPLAISVQNAKNDMDAIQARYDKEKDMILEGEEGITAAEKGMIQAESIYNTTKRRIDGLHAAYTAAGDAVQACQPSQPNSTCSINDKNVLAIQMQKAGDKMMANDEENQKNKNIYEQMYFEYNTALGSSNFAKAGSQTKLNSVMRDLDNAASAYQNLKDQFDKHSVTGTEAQRNCMLESFPNDMAEKGRLKSLLKKCREYGCTQSDYDDGFNEEDFQVKTADELGITAEQLLKQIMAQEQGAVRYTIGGTVRLPDCGEEIDSDCFFRHYTQIGWFDFLSVILFPLAVMFCMGMTGYGYGFCVSNFPYAATDSFMRIMAPYEVNFERIFT